MVLNRNSMDSVLSYITNELYDNRQVMSRFCILYLMPVVLYYQAILLLRKKNRYIHTNI